MSLNKDSEQIDLNIYKSKSTNCAESNETGRIIEDCSALKRLCVALKYNELILCDDDTNKLDQDKKKLFVNFCDTIYNINDFVNDWIHFIMKHSSNEELIKIGDELRKYYQVKACDVTKCNKLKRHYQRRGDEEKYAFYSDCYDRFHHHIFHLFQLGLRVKSINDNHGDDDSDNFQKIVNLIRKSQKQQQNKFVLKRYNKNDNHNSFNNVQIETVKGFKGTTFLDQLYSFIETNDNVTKDEINEFKQYAADNEYDSDAIEDDLDGLNDDESNIYINNNNNNGLLCIEIRKYVETLQLSNASFSTGFIFFYDDKSKEYGNDWNKKEIGDWLNGYSRCQLFVSPHFDTLKQEILESRFLSLNQWKCYVVLKGMEYYKTDKIKHDKTSQNDMMTLSHIFCIILYCDWMDLCIDFSGTFRKKHQFEAIESIKKRHSTYYHFSKGLINAVNRFGVYGAAYYNDDAGKSVYTPFYYGSSLALNVASFAIYLKGPCTTSKNIEIAINFATNNGIIIQLQNDYGDASYQRFFNCSWISNFSEDNSRLFIAGNNRLRIQSIIMVETGQNFEEYMHALYIFDAMISGVDVTDFDDNINITSSDILIINKLCSLNVADSLEIDGFIMNSFRAFCNNKSEIEINIHFLATKFKKISNLLIHNVGRTNRYSWMKDGNLLNILNPSIFVIFPNLYQVVINTTYSSFDSNYEYNFNLLSFLSSIESSKASITYIIKARGAATSSFNYGDNSDKESWINGDILPAPSTTYQYADKGWNIKYDKEKGYGYHDGTDCLIISKMI